jgi:hypothetical protein
MKLLYATILMSLATLAHADVVTSNTANHVVSFTNAQANFAWSPAAVVLALPAPASLSVTISRSGNGSSVVLAQKTVSDADTIIWVPDADYVFNAGSALSVSSTVAQFTVQLHRRPAP